MGRGKTLQSVMLALIMSITGSIQAEYAYVRIAKVDRIPPSPPVGTLCHLWAAPSVNDAGTVAFSAYECGTGKYGLYIGDGGGLTRLYGLGGQTSPANVVPINNAGRVAFLESVGIGTYQVAAYTGDGGPKTLIASSTGPVAYLYPLDINDAGMVAFSTQDDDGKRVVYSGNGGTLNRLIDSSGGYHQIGPNVSINNAGFVAFIASNTFGGDNSRTDYLFGHDGTQLIPLLDTTGPFSRFESIDVSLAAYAFTAQLDTGVHGVFTTDGANVNIVADSTGPFAYFGGGESSAAVSVSDNGRMVFRAYLDTNERGLFTGPDPVADKLIATGDTLFGREVDFVDMGGDAINDAGEVVFYAVCGQTEYIYRAEPCPSPRDSDGDGLLNCDDGCPADPAKTDPGACGCDVADTDSDGDGTADCIDGCPEDPAKAEPGLCGCGESDTSDEDGDGTVDCIDGCPEDPEKAVPGVCGCGVSDALDMDGDGVPDCIDHCPTDAGKSEPGVCGCFIRDADEDADDVIDCVDNCPDASNADQADLDGDLRGDACDECTDADGDGFGNPGFTASTCPIDNCPDVANPDQVDTDADGLGDACDDCTDSDGDGFGDPEFVNTNAGCPIVDDCPYVADAGQPDEDGNGLGDFCEAPCLAWQERTAAPLYLANRASAYDTDRGVLVMFGGENRYVISDETWEWDGDAWTLKPIAGPTRRYSARMAYDSRRKVMVLVGGYDGNTRYGDTWEYDGRRWALRATTGPGKRLSPCMAYDSARGVTVLTGGGESNSPRGTFEWDGNTWTQRTTAGPPELYAAAMAYDAGRGVTVLFGGQTAAVTGAPSSDETWEWDGQEWTLRDDGGGPHARVGHVMMYDSTRGQVFMIFGSYQFSASSNPVYYDDVWTWDGTAWTQQPSIPPQLRPRSVPAFVHDSQRDRHIICGGAWSQRSYSPVVLNDLWEWDGTNWHQRSEPMPEPRVSPAMTYDESRGASLLFGGGLLDTRLSDTWSWDGQHWQLLTTTGPTPRSGPQMAFDRARRVVVLFGGFAGNYMGDTWEWDGQSWTRTGTSGPPGRYWQGMAFDASRDVTVIFGGFRFNFVNGQNVPAYLGDTWEYDGTGWTQRVIAGPPGRMGPGMASDGHTILMYGGQSRNGGSYQSHTDTWLYDGAAWTQVGSDGPQDAAYFRMNYDTGRGTFVMSGDGDYYGTTANEVWEWIGGKWVRRTVTGPQRRSGMSMTYDSARGVHVMVGGGGSETFGDTWELGMIDGDCDGQANAVDNCPDGGNPFQTDADGDGVGDACDDCPRTIPGATVDATGCPPASYGDLDRDGDVDTADHSLLAACASGPAVPHVGSAACSQADRDQDLDVDQIDFAAFQRCFSGKDEPIDPSCAD